MTEKPPSFESLREQIEAMSQVLVSAEFTFRKQRERLELYHSQFRSRRISRVEEREAAKASPTLTLATAGAGH